MTSLLVILDTGVVDLLLFITLVYAGAADGDLGAVVLEGLVGVELVLMVLSEMYANNSSTENSCRRMR